MTRLPVSRTSFRTVRDTPISMFLSSRFVRSRESWTLKVLPSKTTIVPRSALQNSIAVSRIIVISLRRLSSVLIFLITSSTGLRLLRPMSVVDFSLGITVVVISTGTFHRPLLVIASTPRAPTTAGFLRYRSRASSVSSAEMRLIVAIAA